MYKAIVIVNAEVRDTGKIIAASPATEQMVAALKRAIASSSPSRVSVEVVANAALRNPANFERQHPLAGDDKLIYLPLTIDVPENLDFPAKEVFQACKQIKKRRQWVEQKLGYATSYGEEWLGDLWLPIVLTAKGPLYGEVIGEGATPNFYEQPVDFSDRQRQPLYHLAHQLLSSLSCPPAVYLLQFRLRGEEIVFDRLWPFPAAPALASLKVQQPDLFVCQWYCAIAHPILDLTILPHN
ncbi:MAG: hypothetical protein SAL07_12290 [Oscillatoria sp. PMC 1051.18]|nr:hypothetical protein [Oscillatoria sp. PMC 1050.18]MEC5030667.1 hypothetical protein [Oscillatoria sp. PMC 1051.18]